MNAVIMAGGYGNRLKPLTDSFPKPMLNICNRPMIDYCVAQLSFYGIKDIIFSLGFMPEKIMEWTVGYTDLNARFSVEALPLGTLGGVKAAASRLSDVFVVISGDGLNNIDLNAMLSRHLAAKAEVTVAVKETDDPSLYGVASLGADGFIKGFVEKPHNIKTSAYVNCGTYIVNKSALGLVEKEHCDFAKDLFPLLVAKGKLGYYKHRGYWRDIGDFTSYYNANFDMLNASFFPRVKNVYDEAFKSELCGKNKQSDKNAEKEQGFFDEPSLVSQSAIGGGSLDDGRINGCIVGRGCVISAESRLNRCVVMDGARVFGTHEGCILGVDGVIIDVLSKNPTERGGAEQRARL